MSAACAATLGPASALASTAGVSGGVLTYAGGAAEQNVNPSPKVRAPASTSRNVTPEVKTARKSRPMPKRKKGSSRR